MHNLKTGDVAFVMHHDNPISKIMSKVMGSKWSHSALVYDSLESKTLVCETSDFQVNLNWFDRYLKDPNTSLEVLRHPRSEEIFEDRKYLVRIDCDSIVGTLYGYSQLISLGVRRLVKRKIKNFFRCGIVCCHVISYGLRNVEGSGFEKIDPKGFDTEELYQKLKAEGWVTIYTKERS